MAQLKEMFDTVPNVQGPHAGWFAALPVYGGGGFLCIVPSVQGLSAGPECRLVCSHVSFLHRSVFRHGHFGQRVLALAAGFSPLDEGLEAAATARSPAVKAGCYQVMGTWPFGRIEGSQNQGIRVLACFWGLSRASSIGIAVDTAARMGWAGQRGQARAF